MSKLQAICLSALFLFAATTSAKTLYVNGTSGNDSTTYESNSATSPWRTIGRAAWGSTSNTSPNPSQAAKPGDVVQIAAGIYWESGSPSGGRFTVSLNPANTGTASAPITFRGMGMVYVRMQAGFRGGMIGCNGRNYIIWDNLQIDDYYGGSTSDTGPVVFSGGARHCQLVNSDVKGHPGSYYHGYATFGGNYRGISLEPAYNIVIRNNLIHGFRGGQNEAGIMAYDSNDNIIENNELVDNGTAVFIKGVHEGRTQARNIIRKNLVRDNTNGIRVLGSEDALVYQNVVRGTRDAGLWAGFADSARSRFVNNTLYGNQRSIVAQGTSLIDVLFFGNIVASGAYAHYGWSVQNPSVQDVDYDRNVYHQNTVHGSWESGLRLTFSAWRSEPYLYDLNGLNADPLFVDASTANFRLQSGSPARTASLDILDLNNNGSTSDVIPAGAYVVGDEVIGRYTSMVVPPPSPPTGVVAE